MNGNSPSNWAQELGSHPTYSMQAWAQPLPPLSLPELGSAHSPTDYAYLVGSRVSYRNGS
jgi:hypothetical protein